MADREVEMARVVGMAMAGVAMAEVVDSVRAVCEDGEGDDGEDGEGDASERIVFGCLRRRSAGLRLAVAAHQSSPVAEARETRG